MTAADVPEPRVLVGSSFGGFVVVHAARARPAGVGAIVRVVTADGGQSDKADQRAWEVLSSDFTQVGLAGGHDIYADDPAGVTEQIPAAVDAAG